ncbi:MAG: MarR family transcriptional regulator [Bacteroidales bacterium]|nr:MarR family transcriptional regulator [Bacteroidales bacterium]
MQSRYEILKQLIDLWEEYEQDGQQSDLLGFAEWMIFKIKEEPALNKKITGKKPVIEQTEHYTYLKNLDDQTQFIEYISRIARYQEFYTRKFFSDIPINNRLEYLFLHTVNLMEKAKKTDLINIHLVEYTTGMDIIRRLINNDLLEETEHKTDKRAKLLTLTKKGEKILQLANKKMTDERNMFLTCINANKWKKALPVLEEISDFHNKIYLNHNDKPYAELLNLMDSLKHLHK